MELHPWMQGKTGSITTVACASARRVKISYLAAVSTTVSLEGEPIGVLPPTNGFATVSLPLPHEVRDGLNTLAFVADGVNPYGLSISISGVEFELERD